MAWVRAVSDAASIGRPALFQARSAVTLVSQARPKQVVNTGRPAQQRRLYLRPVRASIVSAGDALTVTAVVDEHGLDMVWLDAKTDHAGGNSATNIVQRPRLEISSRASSSALARPQLSKRRCLPQREPNNWSHARRARPG